MNDPIITGTVGMPIRLVLLDRGEPYDPAAASLRQITITQPDGEKITKDVAAGTTRDGRPCLEYVVAEGDLEQPGMYQLSGYVEEEGLKWPAAPVTIYVQRSGR